ncbi:DUF4136 domain-containing protein [Shivajiella indica]|uniref:DUF4136 domain-containing protein n=1 Tax=Shivajiella indica TaxID=872115 RepID=A0ABW5B9Z4_9BACT
MLVVTSFLLSCSTMMQTYSYKDKSVKLKEYKTYAWANLDYFAEENKKGNKVYARLILDLANEELSKKGFVLDTQNPDAVFMFDTKIEDRVSYSQTPSVSVGIGVGGPGYYVGGSVPVAGGNIVQSNYNEGILFIEMYDTKSQKLIWRGWAEEEVSYTTNFETDITRAVKQIFMRLPVTHKSK